MDSMKNCQKPPAGDRDAEHLSMLSVLNCNRASIDPSGLCLVATQAARSLFRRIRIFQFFALISSFWWVSMGLISPEPLSLTMRRAAPLDFQELARASGVARQSLTLELKGSP